MCACDSAHLLSLQNPLITLNSRLKPLLCVWTRPLRDRISSVQLQWTLGPRTGWSRTRGGRMLQSSRCRDTRLNKGIEILWTLGGSWAQSSLTPLTTANQSWQLDVHTLWVAAVTGKRVDKNIERVSLFYPPTGPQKRNLSVLLKVMKCNCSVWSSSTSLWKFGSFGGQKLTVTTPN